MREILFRGKRLDNGEWVYGCLGQHTPLDAFIMDRPYPDTSGELSALGFWEVDTETVGQFTGVVDKAGTKIFEGDILSFQSNQGEDVRTLIYYDTKHAEFSRKHTADIYYMRMEDGVVIGNIHDNPELLEEGTEYEN